MSDLSDKYRKVFGDPIGREVLADILTMTHFGETLNPDNPVKVSEYNVGIAILAKMGVFSAGTRPDVVNALAAISPKHAG